ncbi:MAG: TIGR03668 family PPOX class F420-dependent oxidoreductase [Mycobacteriales bacterium]
MTLDDARGRLAEARVGRLATVRPDGAPHVVPVTFALEGDIVYTGVDGKPKRSRALQRLANIAHEPRVSLLVDAWAEDWSALWWVRADGVARRADAEPRAVAALLAKYPQYADAPPAGPYVVIAVERISGWSAAG